MERIISLGFLFVGITMLLVGVPGAIDTLGVAAHASEFKVTEGEVIGNYVKKHRKGPSTVIVKYKYEVDGKKFKGDNHHTSITDRKGEVDRLIEHEGKKELLPIFYDPSHPSVSVIHRHVSVLWPVGFLAATIAFIVMGGEGLRRDRQVRRRLRRNEEA
jgi:hypothetical protein